MMRICFYAPFKPIGHKHPSGDLVIATGLFEFLSRRGHSLRIASSLRTRWIFWKPWQFPYFLRERRRVVRQCIRDHTELWFSYHSYYKGPDLLGPAVAGQANIPYVIFQGVFSTKRKRDVRTWPGYILNKRALCAAQHVFTNKQVDLRNLKRLLPLPRISYVAPGILPEDFTFNSNARKQLRNKLGLGDAPVVLSAAMFRPGVKTQGLEWVLQACGRLVQRGCRFNLLIAGDGKEKPRLLHLAEKNLGRRVHFVGKVSREKMHEFYSSGDLFVFPGIREGLGMVFLEAQSCGLPVVAFANEGIPEVVKDQVTGFLVPMYAAEPFDRAVEKLLSDQALRRKMGMTARKYVRDEHDLDKNYREMESVLKQIVG
ncbi:MAG: glycosyltransferase family 4 protein [Desulfobacterales bacterium]|jgi:glycosyltransferase involved in cell wall biosynthesis